MPRRKKEPDEQPLLGEGGAPGEASPAPAARAALTVTQAAALVKGVLSEALPGRLRIVGEISNFSQRTHWFFSIKDAGASLRCVCFATTARRVTFPVKDGLQVVVTGRVDFFPGQGSLQVYVDAIEPVGQGALELRYQQLCAELRGLGYFDDARKRVLPLMPRSVAVVTSRSGAALQDVINTASKRWPGCRLLLVDVKVQGPDAAPQIAAALDKLSSQGEAIGVEVIILTRGGGSIEDLWAFNERVVADAIFRCALPVVAAIGHESDTTIAELVADLRCSTPTQAVMTVIPDRAALQAQVTQARQRLTMTTRRQISDAANRVQAVARNPIFRRPESMIEQRLTHQQTLSRRLAMSLQRQVPAMSQRTASLAQALSGALRHRAQSQASIVASLRQRLSSGVLRTLHDSDQAMQAAGRQLDAVGPANVLRRGFTYTLDVHGSLVRSVQTAAPGSTLTTVFADGRLQSRVIAPGQPAQEDVTNSAAMPRFVRRKRPRGSSDPAQPGLFGDER
jgi:exodeoxyribonuclease VII large subunit